jgi:SHS2 domain-containing protein
VRFAQGEVRTYTGCYVEVPMVERALLAVFACTDINSGDVTVKPHWEHFPHGADIGVRGFGTTLAEAFEQAALAMEAVIVELVDVEPVESIEMTAEAPAPDLLLVDWLNAIVYEMATRRMLFSRFDVRTDGGRLDATAWGEHVNPAKHQPAVEVKGATYTALRTVQQHDGTWMVQCVVDV